MKAKFVHRCTHVLDKEATIKFYQEALGMKVVREMGPEDGSWTNTFMANDEAPFEDRAHLEPRAGGALRQRRQGHPHRIRRGRFRRLP